VGLLVLTGALIFFVIEYTLVIFRGKQGHHGHSHGHHHGNTREHSTDHEHEVSSPQSPVTPNEPTDEIELRSPRSRARSRQRRVTSDASEPISARTAEHPNRHSVAPARQLRADATLSKAGERTEENESLFGNVSHSGLLNLIADFTHNFTDGLTIAAAYSSGSQAGISTTLAVMLHEIPHELGDYAVLIQSGFTPRNALLAQGITAIGAVMGCVTGLAASHLIEGANQIILPITAGGFIYLAFASIVPSLMETDEDREDSDDDDKVTERSKNHPLSRSQIVNSLLHMFCLVLAASLGVFLMVVITWFE